MLRFSRKEENQAEAGQGWQRAATVVPKPTAPVTGRARVETVSGAVVSGATVAVAREVTSSEQSPSLVASDAILAGEQKEENVPVLLGRRMTRRRKVALGVLVVAGLVGARWLTATVTWPGARQYQPRVEPYPAAPRELTAPNAQHFYSAAVEALGAVPGKLSFFVPENATLAEKRAAVAQGRAVLELVHQGTQYDYHPGATSFYRTTLAPRQFTLDAPVPDYVAARTLARLMAAESDVLAAEGKHDLAIRAALEAARFGQHMGKGNALLDGIVGLMLESTGLAAARARVAALSPAEARSALNRLDEQTRDQRRFGQLVETERRMLTNTLTQMFQSREGAYVPWLAAVFWYGRTGLVDSINAHFDESVRRGLLPYQEARSLANVPLPALPFLVREWVPETQKSHKTHATNAALREILRAELALQAARGEHHGARPVSLELLTRGANPYLSAVPLDPFSSDGKQPLRYRDGKPYSVGENGRDDGGLGDDLPHAFKPGRK
jgi:hypothetical protein